VRAAVPDPYPIDDDQDLLDDESPTTTPRPEPSRRKSKRDSVQPGEPLTAPPSADDPVLVERMEVDPAPAEAERPRHREQRDRERERPRRERGNSDAMGTLAGVAGTAAAVSGFKNMFGLGRKKGAPAPEEDRRDRRRTAYETEDERKRRKRSTTRGGMTEEEAKRLRHERRSVRKPTTRVADDEPEPMMTGANGSGEVDPEREARRAARRAKHEQDKGSRRAELEEVEAKAERRRDRARDVEQDTTSDKKARQMAELERRNKLAEEELLRMAEKDERRKSRKPTEDGTREHRSSRRKEKEPREASRPQGERRRSHVVDDDADRRRRHDERRAARRNSDYPVQPSGEPIADYFDERNGAAQRPTATKERSSRRVRDEEQNMPYSNKGPDKTSSWIQSLSDEPPLPPPISETVLDPVPRGSPDDEETPSQDEDIRLRIAGRRGGGKRDKVRDDKDKEKDKKHSRRKSHYGETATRGSVEEGTVPDKRKDRRKTYAAPVYEDQPVRTWDGRPALDGNAGAGKRGSWFKKIF
jgi:hypothetical protein